MTKLKLRVDYYGAGLAGDNRKALDIVTSLGIEWDNAIPQPIADCWIFEGCVNVPDDLPSYVEVIK